MSPYIMQSPIQLKRKCTPARVTFCLKMFSVLIFFPCQAISAEVGAHNGQLVTLEAKVAESAAEYRSPELTVLAKDVAGLKWKQESITQKASKVCGAKRIPQKLYLLFLS